MQPHEMHELWSQLRMIENAARRAGSRVGHYRMWRAMVRAELRTIVRLAALSTNQLNDEREKEGEPQ